MSSSYRAYFLVTLAIFAFVVVFVVVLVLDLRSEGSAAGGAPGGVENVDVGEAGQHAEGDVDYEQTPPAGGEHDNVLQNEGFYEEPVRDENAVHTLEHGAVWITYSPDLPQGQVDAIRRMAEGQTCVLASPYEGLDSPVVASAWGKQLRLEGADDPDLERFIRSYRQGPQTPEPGAPCTGGIASNASSPGGGAAVGAAFAEAALKPVGDSGVSGDAVFKEVGSLGVQVELEVSGLPAPGDPEEPEQYFAQVHGGSCAEAPRGGSREPKDDHGGGGPPLALVRLDRFFGAAPEYADHPEYEPPPADGLPGNVDAPLSLGASAGGTAAVTSLLEGVEPEELTSGGPKYVDLRVPSHEPPEDWSALACANLG